MYIHFAYAIHLQRGKARPEPAAARAGFRRCAKGLRGATFTYEDDRFDYSEQRFVTLGVLEGVVVSIVHTETPRQIRIISFRKATKHEQEIFFKNL
jgi:uncharacterized DUF497 family protein